MSAIAGLRGWTPVRVYRGPTGLRVDWAHLGEARFIEPFFEETVGRALSNPAQLLFRRETPLETVAEWAAVEPTLPPSGFIFHMSRCGSTLVAQMLAAVERHLVIAEAAPLDQVLTAHLLDPSASREQRVRWLRGMIGALGQARRGETRYFVKFDCWHMQHFALIREAFPTVPWVFVYREPREVLVSHLRLPGSQILPGGVDPRALGLTEAWSPGESLMNYAARVLGGITASAAQAAEAGQGMLVNFSELPAGITARVCPHFGLDFTPEEWALIRAASGRDAKRPAQRFENDTAAKRAEVTPEIAEVCARWLDASYLRLETVRQASLG